MRFVHSLVITMLFKKLDKKELYNIFKLAVEHGKNLGMFVFAYKFSTLVLEKIFGKNSADIRETDAREPPNSVVPTEPCHHSLGGTDIQEILPPTLVAD